MQRLTRPPMPSTSSRFTIRRRGREVERPYKQVSRHIAP